LQACFTVKQELANTDQKWYDKSIEKLSSSTGEDYITPSRFRGNPKGRIGAKDGHPLEVEEGGPKPSVGYKDSP
jgi:hypothetical protein